MKVVPYRHMQHGASAVEFTFMLPILLLILWSVVTFATMLHARMVIARAAEDAARSVSFFSSARTYSELATTPFLDECSAPNTPSVQCEALASLERSLLMLDLGQQSSPYEAIKEQTTIDVAAGTCGSGPNSLGVEVRIPFAPLRILPPIIIPGFSSFAGWMPTELSACAVVAL